MPLLAAQVSWLSAERVDEAERKQAEAERERAEAAKLLVLLLGGLEDAGVQKQGIARADGCRKGSTVAVAKLLADGGDDMDARRGRRHLRDAGRDDLLLTAAP